MNKKELLKPSGKKCKCGNDIPVGRVKYSKRPNICTACDDSARKGAINIINGKVGNTIQIVDMETSARINKMQDRKGSIVGAGVRGVGGSTR